MRPGAYLPDFASNPATRVRFGLAPIQFAQLMSCVTPPPATPMRVGLRVCSQTLACVFLRHTPANPALIALMRVRQWVTPTLRGMAVCGCVLSRMPRAL